MDELLRAMSEVWRITAQATYPYAIPVIIGAGAAAITCGLYDMIRSLWRGAMQKRGRRHSQHNRMFAAQLITEVFEEAHAMDLWSKEDKDSMYQVIGSRCDMPSLLPGGPRFSFPIPDKLKEEVRKRIKGLKKLKLTRNSRIGRALLPNK